MLSGSSNNMILVLVLLLILLVLLHTFVRRQYSYWDRHGIVSAESSIPFGNLKSVVKKQRSFGTAIYDIYKQTTEPLIGVYLFFRPAILVRDAELIKNILLSDFQHFHDRGVYCEPETDPMSATLFGLPGEKWKNLRVQLTPAFTSGKLKAMFGHIRNVGEELAKLIEPIAEKEEPIEIRNIVRRYVADCMASIAFGLEGVSSLNDPDHEFLKNIIKMNDTSKLIEIIRRNALFLCPK